MPEFTLPVTAEQWAAVEPNVHDYKLVAIAEACDVPTTWDEHSDMRNRVAAASRLLERERCVAALAVHLFDGSESMSVAVAEARRILEDTK